MSHYFDQLEAELRAAVPRAAAIAAAGASPRRWRPAALRRSLLPLMGAGVTVAVVAVTLLLAGRAPNAPRRFVPGGAPTAPRRSVPGGAPTAPRRSVPGRTPAVIPGLGTQALLGVSFGTPTATAVRALSAQFGAGADLTHPVRDCGVDGQVSWLGADHRSGASPLEETLTLTLRAGRFVGYRYGLPTDAERDYIALDPETGTVLTRIELRTADGLAVGDSVARLGRLWGRSVAISSAQGGRWSARVGGDRLGGFTTGHPAVVSTIEAGAVGCPAATR